MTASLASSVVVGVDGSPGSEAALDWAVGEARARGLGLHVIHGFGRELAVASMGVIGRFPVPDTAAIAAAARRLLDHAVRRARESAPDVPVSHELDEDDAVTTLVQCSASSPLVVVGSRRRGPIGSAVLGSVGAAVAAGAHGPVVVVRGPAGIPAEHPCVVVGVDLFVQSDDVMRFAFEHAERGGMHLEVLCCWSPDLLAGMMWRPQQPAPAWVVDKLAEIVRPYESEFPHVKVHSAVVRDHAVDGLVAAADAQALVVVGSTTRHPRVGSLLGSVSQGVLHHVTCPVAVVPT
ncbi:MAG TPA: universal stress protein [Jatrophihabitantaceae bacterium]|jgi:nucleotide-binding universal stress UspA family protein|nr:universal stress protein [Jatrophihabitantaceae bacterium]